MEEKLTIIEHKGQKLLYANFAGLGENEILALFDQMKVLCIQHNIHLQIVNVSNTNTTPKIKETAITTRQEIANAIGTIYSSLVGLHLAQQIVANVISRDQYFASNLEDAKDWLVKKYEKYIEKQE
jgi:hypothetical protein